VRRLINALVVVLVLVLAAGLVLAAIPKLRDAASRQQCQNNLKQFGIALHNYLDTHGAFPSATIPNDSLPCGQRLSWLVDTQPYMEQLYVLIDRKKAWDDEVNRVPRTRYEDVNDHWIEKPLGEYKLLRCPANPAVAAPDSPGLTDYVGISGIGKDAAELALGYPGVGFFGCQRRMKREDIKDGMDSTIMVMETNSANGPWTAGGFPTTRGLNLAGSPYLGAGGQFSSGHRSYTGWLSPRSSVITNVVFADGSVRGLADSVSPQVLEALVTIAGGEEVGPVGD
jgi:prepilin-type processing-associated H-X9-DG protein